MVDYKEAHGFRWVSGERGDDYILKESSYKCLFPPKNTTSFQPNDVWLDIGAHFGSFAIRASPYVEQVIAVEPAPGNIIQLWGNMKLNGVTNIVPLEAAVLGDETQKVKLSLGHTFDYTHRVGTVRGRESITVQGFNVNELVHYYRVNKIKMDCEGSEEEILAALDYRHIQELILEWHFTLIPDADWTKLRHALDRLKSAGFEILRCPKELSFPTKRWTAIIWARKLG